jgi:hypothetical protein
MRWVACIGFVSVIISLILITLIISIDVEQEGEEAIFVTRMLAGRYHFTRLEQTGFSNAYADIDVPFKAHFGKPV